MTEELFSEPPSQIPYADLPNPTNPSRTEWEYSNEENRAWWDHYRSLSNLTQFNTRYVASALYVGGVGLGLGSALMLLPNTGKVGKVTKQKWWPYAGTFLVAAGAFYLTAPMYDANGDKSLIGLPSTELTSSYSMKVRKASFIGKRRIAKNFNMYQKHGSAVIPVPAVMAGVF